MKYKSLLETTENTRDLGGYRILCGGHTRKNVILRSDIQKYPSKRDLEYLKKIKITTVIDMRSEENISKSPSGFAGIDGFRYFNFPISEGSGIPESRAAVPHSYLKITEAPSMPNIFRCIANAENGVMINCTAGKDRTGVVTAILLLNAGVRKSDIISDYVVTKHYARGRIEAVRTNLPEVDIGIVIPCREYIEKFFELFTRKYGNTDSYFGLIGLDESESETLRRKLRGY